jgi:hypothetical protein
MSPASRDVHSHMKIWFFFQTTSNGETLNMKVVDPKKLWNFVVCNFLIWNHIVNEIHIWISQIWNSNFVNNLEWRNSQDESCTSWEVMKLFSWQVFSLNTFKASKHDLHSVYYNMSRMKTGCGCTWLCGVVVEEALHQGGGHRFEPRGLPSSVTICWYLLSLQKYYDG